MITLNPILGKKLGKYYIDLEYHHPSFKLNVLGEKEQQMIKIELINIMNEIIDNYL